MRAHSDMPDKLYEVYEHAFRALRRVTHDRSVSLSSVALELERLLASYPEDVRQGVSLALGDALGCLPLKSRTHLSRELGQQPEDEPNRH